MRAIETILMMGLFVTGCQAGATTADNGTVDPLDISATSPSPDLMPNSPPDLMSDSMVDPMTDLMPDPVDSAIQPPPSDLRAPLTFSLAYRTYTAHIQAGTNNGFAADCAGMVIPCGDPNDKARTAPPFTKLTLIVTNVMTSAAATTKLDCVAGSNFGTAEVNLPDSSGGPFTIKGGMDGVNYPLGFVGVGKVDPFHTNDAVEVPLYACGCDDC